LFNKKDYFCRNILDSKSAIYFKKNKKMTNKIVTIFTFICYLFLNPGCTKAGVEGNVEASDLLKMLSKGKDIVMKEKIIKGDLNFTTLKELEHVESSKSISISISSSIVFINCSFEGKLIGYNVKKIDEKHTVVYLTRFKENITFVNCEFKDVVDLNEIIVDGSLEFNGSNFHKTASFEGANFRGREIQFMETTFKDDALFNRVKFENTADFMRTTFTGNAGFQAAEFKGEVQFGVAKFQKYADFTNSEFSSGSFFQYAEIGRGSFNGSIFRGRVDFSEIKFIGDIEMQRVTFYGKTKFSKSSIQSKFDLENSVFMMGKPEIKDLKKETNCKINLTNTIYFQSVPFKTEDF